MLRGIKLIGLLLAITWLGGFIAWREGQITSQQLLPVARQLEHYLGSATLELAPHIAEWGAIGSALILIIWLLAEFGIGVGRAVKRRSATNQELQNARQQQTISAYEKVLQTGFKGLLRPRKALRLATAGRDQQITNYAEQLRLCASLLHNNPAGIDASRAQRLALLCTSLQESLHSNRNAETRQITLQQPLRLGDTIHWRPGTSSEAQPKAGALEEITQQLGDQADRILEQALGHDFDWRNLVAPEQVRELERPSKTLYESAQQLPNTIATALQQLTEPPRTRQRNAPQTDWQEVRRALSERITVDFIRRSFNDRGWYAKHYANLQEHAPEILRMAVNSLWPREQELFKQTAATTQTPPLQGIFILPVPGFGEFRFWGDKRSEATIEPSLAILETAANGLPDHAALGNLEVAPEKIQGRSAEEIFSCAFVSLMIRPVADLTIELRRSLDACRTAQAAPDKAKDHPEGPQLQFSQEEINTLAERITEMEAAIQSLDPIQMYTEQVAAKSPQSPNRKSSADSYSATGPHSEPKPQAKEPIKVSCLLQTEEQSPGA